jgi:DNA-binding protein YbaB
VLGEDDQGDRPTYDGRDPTETVRVTIDGDGLVTDVAIEPVWWERVDPRRLGTAVLEAITAAGRERILRWSAELPEAPDERPARRAVPVAIDPSRSMINHVLDLLDKVQRAGDTPPLPGVTSESDGGHVTVSVHGKQVFDVEMDSNWLGMANHLEVAGELRSALATAYAAIAEQPAAEIGAAAELRALTANPEQFVNALFGIQR